MLLSSLPQPQQRQQQQQHSQLQVQVQILVDATREANPHSQFLYNTAQANPYITDYQIHLAPSGDYQGKEQEEHARYHPGHPNDTERHIRPYFLKPYHPDHDHDRDHESEDDLHNHHHNPHRPYHPDDEEKTHDNHSYNRIIQFYNPWSGTSQNYAKTFLQLAKDMYALYHDKYHLDPEVKFYTISCSAHPWICHDNQITTYPTIVMFPKYSTQYKVWEEDIHALTVEALQQVFQLTSSSSSSLSSSSSSSSSLSLLDTEENVHVQEESESQDLDETNDAQISTASAYVELEAMDINSFATLDIVKASKHVYQRVRRETYADAAVSFTYALRHDIFTTTITTTTSSSSSSSSSSLSEEQKEAFVDWIDLLYWALPSNWRLHTLINDIRNNLDSVLESKDALIHLVDLHHDVVHERHGSHSSSSPQDNYNLEDKEALEDDKKAVFWSEACAQKDIHHHLQLSANDNIDNDNIDNNNNNNNNNNDQNYGPPHGYTCGLWNLIHIVSVGVAESHAAVLGARERATVSHAMYTISQYLTHFTSSLGTDFSTGYKAATTNTNTNINSANAGGQAEGGGETTFSTTTMTTSTTDTMTKTTTTTSSAIFLKEHINKCIVHPYHHCPNLYPRKKKKQSSSSSSLSSQQSQSFIQQRQEMTEEQWRQMPLYLWEIHNAYNVEVWKYIIQSQKGYIPHNKEEEMDVMWPKREICDGCRQHHGSRQKWDREVIYQFLKDEYWYVYFFYFIELDWIGLDCLIMYCCHSLHLWMDESTDGG